MLENAKCSSIREKPNECEIARKRLNKCVLRWENESFIFLYEILEGFVEKFMVAPQKPSTFCEVSSAWVSAEFRIFGDISRLWIRRESWSRERFPPQPFAAYNPRTKNLQ